MAPSIALLTMREPVAQHWREALHGLGLEAMTCTPGKLPHAVADHKAVIVDVEGPAFDSNELLSTLGFVRASNVLPVAYVERGHDTLEGIVYELCDGLVAQGKQDVARVASAIRRRTDRQRDLLFEFVAVSPFGDEVLAVLGNGDASLHRRPIDTTDDGSTITSIAIGPDGGRATLRLQSGRVCQLTPSSVHAVSDFASKNADTVIDGERLGARLRELRLAAGLTQAELSRRTGIHRPNIARVEAGRHTPSLETLTRIATAIGVSATQILVSRSS